jgi:C-terminal processing protease CtpA/Prc
MSQLVEPAELVDALIDRLGTSYVFPERSAAAADLLRANLTKGRYDLPVGPALCEVLSADLLEACADRHLRLIWHESVEASQDEEQLVAELRQLFRLENQGVRRVERLPGNVGLIELTIIPDAATAGPALAAAMRLVEQTHVLILDLRGTRGGAPDGVAFLASFLFPDGEVHLNDIVEGPEGPTRQYWTSSYVPGPRYADRPIYALTSANTFSGGEELAYDLQALERATIVGEITRGGAHPSEVVSLGLHVELRLPVARGINPVTGGNWEGIGVQPDVRAPATEAFDVALRLALETISDDQTVPEASRTEADRHLGYSRA